jgi:hypothetical protein
LAGRHYGFSIMEAGVPSLPRRFESLWPVVLGLLAYAAVVTCLLWSIDTLVDRQPGPDRALWAILDNTIHALVAFLLLLPLFLLRIRSLAVPLLGAVLASLIDLDHFVAAGSFSLRDALSLPCRPWTHSLVFVLPAAALAGLLARRFWIFAVAAAALTSHILRDATTSPAPLLYPLPDVTLPWWAYALAFHLLMTASVLLASSSKSATSEREPLPTLPRRLPLPASRHLRTN